MQRHFLTILVTLAVVLVVAILYVSIEIFNSGNGVAQEIGQDQTRQLTDVPALLSITPSIAATATSEFIIHSVASEETLFDIGLQYGITPSILIEMNNITDPELLQVGQQLKVPVTVTPIPTATPVPAEPQRGIGSTQDSIILIPTPTLAAALESTPTPTPPLPEPPANAPTTINGISRTDIALMSTEVLANGREIFNQGRQMGRNPRAFSILGDSVVGPPFFQAYDRGGYDLGGYGYLEGVIQHFSGSFGRESISLRAGLHSWTAFDPVWADKHQCLPNEGPLPCELRNNNPSLLIIRLGSNDVGVPDYYESQMRRILEYTIENRVIPILGTKADRNEGSNINNEIVRRLATEFQIPLWDFDLVANTIDERGLDTDGIHLNAEGMFYQNISALVVLDRLWREVTYAPRIS